MRKFSSLCRVPLRWIFLSLSLDWKFHMQVHSNRPQHNFCWNFLCIFSTTKIQFKCSRNVSHRIPKIHEIFTGNSERKYRSTDLNKHLLSMFTPAAVKDDNRRMQLNFLCAFYLFYFRDTCDILLSTRSCCKDFRFDSFTHFWTSDGCPHIFQFQSAVATL